MTLEDMKQLQTLQTATIAEDMKDEETFFYVVNCLNRFYSGDYGEVPPEDTEANNRDLNEGYGHILARYKAYGKLKGDFYIEAHFDKDAPAEDVDYNNVFICYPEER